nr:MAG TPA: hypothetical protein [Caudoviricetes sp.]
MLNIQSYYDFFIVNICILQIFVVPLYCHKKTMRI